MPAFPTFPHPAQKSAIEPEQLAQDLPHLVGLLWLIEGTLPGQSVADLLAHLDHAQQNPVALGMLAKALSGGRT